VYGHFVMLYLYALLLICLNAVWLFLTAIGLPGNWLIVLTVAVCMWLWPDLHMFHLWTLIALVVLAGIGEVVEFLSGAIGVKKAGGTRWGAWGSIVGGILGGLFGTAIIPVPVVGTLVGLCVGAFAGATVLEFAGGRTVEQSYRSGRGAAIGRAFGVVAKLAIGAVMWLVVAIAAVWP
jgi:uncharacterized protein YqgC (DUF456 family)